MTPRFDPTNVTALLYRVEEAAAALRLSRSAVYELIRSGQLRTSRPVGAVLFQWRRWLSTWRGLRRQHDTPCPW